MSFNLPNMPEETSKELTSLLKQGFFMLGTPDMGIKANRINEINFGKAAYVAHVQSNYSMWKNYAGEEVPRLKYKIWVTTKTGFTPKSQVFPEILDGGRRVGTTKDSYRYNERGFELDNLTPNEVCYYLRKLSQAKLGAKRKDKNGKKEIK